MFSIADNPILTLEALGIFLAVLGFSGADKHVERGLNGLRDFVREWTPLFYMVALFGNPTWENLKKQWPVALKQMVVPLIVGLLIVPFDPGAQERLAFYYSMGEPWTYWKVALTVVAAPFALVLIWSVVGSAISVLLYVASTIVWRVFWVLSRPPSGVLGTIGLVIALASPLARLASA